MRGFFLIFLVFITSPSWAQDQTERLEKARAFVEDFNKIEQGKRSTGYNQYLLVAEHMGTLKFVEPDMIQRVQHGNQLKLAEESRALFNKYQRYFDPRGFKGEDKALMAEARNATGFLRRWATSLDAERAFRIVQEYNSNAYSIKLSFKDRMAHLPMEMAQFAAAIVIVRMATCFGDSAGKVAMSPLMEFQTPVAMKASHKDPACITEIFDMLKSPIFHAGFLAFVAGSAIGQASTLKLLEAIDPGQGKFTEVFKKSYLPNLAMAVGFLSDHLVKTLLQNKNIQHCATTDIPATLKGSKESQSAREDKKHKYVDSTGGVPSAPQIFANFEEHVIATITEDGEDYQVIDVFGKWGPNCRRAWQHIKSHQFLSEELGVGLTGLIVTAVALSKVTKTAVNTANWFKHVSKISLVLTPTGVVGVAIGVTRMAVFLGLFEIIEPFVHEAFVVGALDPLPMIEGLETSVDASTDRLTNAYWALTPATLSLNSTPQCPTYYSGHQEDNKDIHCYEAPLVAEIKSFHDFSKTWRSKYILKEFNQSFSFWKKKLSSFIDNYFQSMEQVKVLSRSREVYWTGESEFEKFYQSIRVAEAMGILDAEFGDEGAQIFEEVQEEFQKDIADKDYVSPIRTEEFADDPRRMVFEIFAELYERNGIYLLNKEGDLFYGLFKENYVPTDEEVAGLLKKVSTFVDLSQPGQINYVRIDNPFKEVGYTLPSHLQDLAKEKGFPGIPTLNPNFLELIGFLISTKSAENQTLALIIFKDWLPFMKGQFPICPEAPPHGKHFCNPRGMEKKQWKLYNEISKALKTFDPLFPFELLYSNSTYSDKARQKKTEADAQFNENILGYDAKQLSDFVLINLMCGKGVSLADYLGDKGGLALHFQFPHLLGENICANRYLEIYNETYTHAATLRSLYLNDNDLYVGLHNAYIRAPEDSSWPLIFNKEQKAGEWWNSDVKMDSLNRLREMEAEYHLMVDEEFNTKISNEELHNEGWFARQLRRWIPWVDNGSQQDAARYPTTNSLNVSLVNELYHYQGILQHILTEDELKKANPIVRNFRDCLVKMVNSIPEKKYRVTETQCKDKIEDVKRFFTTPDGKYNSGTGLVQFISGFDGVTADTTGLLPMDLGLDIPTTKVEKNAETIKHRVLIEIGQHMLKLVTETAGYNDMANESFKFDLTNEE